MTDSTSRSSSSFNLYAYEPSHVLPIVFAVLIGISLSAHVYQNFRFGYWHITFFMFYGGVVFMSGWIVRAVSSYRVMNLGLYISQLVLTLAGPPIYAAAEYNILGRLMHYLPMHAPLNPSRVFVLFITLGVIVESLTGVGAGQLAGADLGTKRYLVGGVLISITLVLQAIVECMFVSLVVLIHYRCRMSGMLSSNVKTICYTLYGTSFLIFFRCIFRAVESFTIYTENCGEYHCGTISRHEWFLYVFEATPMVIYTFWLNIIHPGRFLPIEHTRFLDVDGVTERMGPGWIDDRPKWKKWTDPLDFSSLIHDRPQSARFWLDKDRWPVCGDGSFASGTATNRGKKSSLGKRKNLSA